jgi:regulator of protease activity HflC (stomatin/prohibitin superfamily)
MRIKVMGTGTNVAITKDNVKINIETSVAFRVTNPIIVYYQIGQGLNRAVI